MNNDALADGKQRLRIPELWRLLGMPGEPGKSCHAPWREDKNPSFSVFDDDLKFHDFATGEHGDAIDFLARARGLSLADAIAEFKKLAGVADSPPPAPRSQPSTHNSQPSLDWPQCVRDFTPEHAARFAKWRALTLEFVAAFQASGRIGLFHNRLAFPVHDDSGVVVRAHVRAVKRQADGSENVFWFYTPKGPGLPLVIGDALTASTVWAFESQFDMLAALDLAGWHKSPDGLPGIAAVATRGAENGKRLAGLLSPVATLVLFPQNDPLRSDRAETPAQKWTREAAAHSGCKTIQIVATPGDFKDLNDALRAGLTPEEFQAALAAAQPYTPPPDLHATPPRRVSKPVTLPPEDEADAADTPQPFPIESFPPPLASIVAAVARCERVPAALPAVCALGVASAAIGTGLEILSAADRVTRANLFLLADAESGSGKSQVFRRIAEPIVEHQHQLHETHREKTAPDLASEIGLLIREIKRTESKAARSNDPDDRERMLDELKFKRARKGELEQKIAPPCVICGDVTSEKLAVLLAMNRETLFSASPEARQIVDIVCGRYNSTKSTDEAIYLSSFSGDFLRVDRLGRDALTLRKPCLSVLWLVQPDAMARLFETETLAQSGFLPRFLCCHTQAAPRRIVEGESQAVSDSVRTRWVNLIAELLATYHAAEKPHRVEPTPEAKRVLDDFFNAVVDRREGELSDVGQFASRYGEQAWRVALTLHASHYGQNAHNHALAAETALSAIAVVQWFVDAQLTVMARSRRQAAEKLEEQVLELLETNRERKGQDFTTAREVQRARIVASADAARALLDRMERDGLLVGEDITPPHGGKVTRIFRAAKNPVPE